MMTTTETDITFAKITTESQLPNWLPRKDLVRFFHESMKPWHDTVDSIERSLDYAFSKAKGEGGFLLIAEADEQLASALLMLNTGMSGYVPENLLLFVSVDPSRRGQGLGSEIIRRAVAECKGDVKLHVDYPNPAKRLYERLGFTNKYAEMRLQR